jgi:NAD(P)H-hydrate epimerase
MRSGVGKLTLHTPESNASIVQTALPEVVLHTEPFYESFATVFDANQYDAMAIGPGIGTDEETSQAVIEQIQSTNSYTVIDADAINILSSHTDWIQLLPQNSILTPHKKELAGIIGISRNCFEELEKTRELAIKQKIFIIIKGAFSVIITPEGECHFNPTGNPGMATAGSGDVLTGIILALLARGNSPLEASILGTYIHGMAGDIATETIGEESLIASDIIDHLPQSFMKLKQNK